MTLTEDRTPNDDGPPSVGLPVREGQAVTLCLRSGDAITGRIDAVDENFVQIVTYDWLSHRFAGVTLAVRIDDCQRIQWAEAERGTDGTWNYAMTGLYDCQRRWTDANSTRNSL